jgi:hypothetical protein
MGEFISGNYFRMFGLQPAVGRLLSDTDDVAGSPVVAVMSYATWKDVYNGDDSVVGSTFWMNTKPVTVVGVAPEGFYGDRMSSTDAAGKPRKHRGVESLESQNAGFPPFPLLLEIPSGSPHSERFGDGNHIQN